MARRTTPPKGAQNDAPESEPLVGAGLGQVAYDAYSAFVDGVSAHGEALPSWAAQTENNPHVAAAWCAAAQAVITATIKRSP